MKKNPIRFFCARHFRLSSLSCRPWFWINDCILEWELWACLHSNGSELFNSLFSLVAIRQVVFSTHPKHTTQHDPAQSALLPMCLPYCSGFFFQYTRGHRDRCQTFTRLFYNLRHYDPCNESNHLYAIRSGRYDLAHLRRLPVPKT